MGGSVDGRGGVGGDEGDEDDEEEGDGGGEEEEGGDGGGDEEEGGDGGDDVVDDGSNKEGNSAVASWKFKSRWESLSGFPACNRIWPCSYLFASKLALASLSIVAFGSGAAVISGFFMFASLASALVTILGSLATSASLAILG